jgi:VWFA-related protein
MRTMAAAVALLSVAVVVRAATWRSQQTPRFHSDSSELVVLPVTVTDRQGQLVADLPRDRFTVYDNGRPEEIALFSNEDTPVTLGLILDNSGSMRAKLAEVVAATATLAKESNPDDEMFTLVFNDQVRNPLEGHPVFANDVLALTAALQSLRPDGQTSMYDGLTEGLRRIAEGTRPRKVLVLVSDGGDNASRSSLKEVLARARLSNVTIYTIGVFDRDDPDANPRVLKALADATGGERFLPQSPGPLLKACGHIAREIRAGYTIAYVPPERDGAYHRVRVDVERLGAQALTVRTRPGYFAGGVAPRLPE